MLENIYISQDSDYHKLSKVYLHSDFQDNNHKCHSY